MKVESSPYDAALSRAIYAATERICSKLAETMPLAGQAVVEWMKRLSRTENPGDYYHHPRGSAMFLFPWYLHKGLDPNPNQPLHSDLVYSTVNGYYFIRLIDNLTDRHGTDELALLPALGFFHAEFQGTYQRYFDPGHPFWDFFARTWYHSADVTLRDLGARDMDRQMFVQVAAHKTCAIKIPIGALCYQYDRPELLVPWSEFMDVFGCWHQMYNDLFHWNEDARCSTVTYFLSEARRRIPANGSVAEWIIEEGFEWGVSVLDEWMEEARTLAAGLESDELMSYLDYRQELLCSECEEYRESLRLASKIKGLLG